MLQPYPESGCGGGFFLYGLDAAGEWAQYNEPFEQGGAFQAGLICRGEFNTNYELKLVFTDITATESVTWGAVKSLYE